MALKEQCRRYTITSHAQNMQLTHPPKTSDRFGRYYTRGDVARVLVGAMAQAGPRLTLDLGAGDGTLAAVASQQWRSSRFVTVDIDADAKSENLRRSHGPSFTHHVADALSRNLAAQIGVRLGEVDSAVCNPPYVRPKWRRHFGEILEDAGLSGVVPRLSGVGADTLFIAQNLRFLNNGGKLGLILPDGVIAGEKYARLRASIASSHHLEKVIELPRGIFSRTDAKAYVVVLTKGARCSDDIILQRLLQSGQLSDELALTSDRAIERLDYTYQARFAAPHHPRQMVLKDVAVMVQRGSYSSAQRRDALYPVFHTTDFEQGRLNVPDCFLLPIRTKTQARLAIAGDILIARVGRNLVGKVCVVQRDAVATSDCVLTIRVQEAYRARVLRFLRGSRGRTAIAAIAHGVSASFITTEALLNLQI